MNADMYDFYYLAFKYKFIDEYVFESIVNEDE